MSDSRIQLNAEDALRVRLVQHESLKLSPYRDSKGFLTIGIGHNLDAKPISRRAAFVILEDDIMDAIADLDRALPWWRQMDAIRRSILTEMCFNLGLPRLLSFRKALGAMQRQDWATAATEMLDSKWAREDVGKRANVLADIMRSGKL